MDCGDCSDCSDSQTDFVKYFCLRFGEFGALYKMMVLLGQYPQGKKSLVKVDFF